MKLNDRDLLEVIRNILDVEKEFLSESSTMTHTNVVDGMIKVIERKVESYENI